MTREEAVARIKDHIEIHRYHEQDAVKIFEALDMAIKALEQPEQKTGHWIYGEDNSGTGRDGWFCSKCGHFEKWDYSTDMKSAEINLSNFCPNCGVAMTEGLWCKNDKRMIKEKPDSNIECLWNEVK